MGEGGRGGGGGGGSRMLSYGPNHMTNTLIGKSFFGLAYFLATLFF